MMCDCDLAIVTWQLGGDVRVAAVRPSAAAALLPPGRWRLAAREHPNLGRTLLPVWTVGDSMAVGDLALEH
jgi:hypothetical protein